MKAIKWIVIGLALIVAIAITVPSTGFCSHNYVYQNGCLEKVCTNCGETTARSSPLHAYQTIDCNLKKCTNCGIEVHGDAHKYEKVPCTTLKKCSVCNYILRGTEEYHNRTSISEGCTTINSCADCGKYFSTTSNHKWVSENCEDWYYCKLCCSTDTPEHMDGHSYATMSTFFDLPKICRYCGEWYFPPLTFGAVCVYFGVLMIIAAFIFIFINRKRITIREGRYFRAVIPEYQMREKTTEEEYL